MWEYDQRDYIYYYIIIVNSKLEIILTNKTKWKD